MSHPYPLQVIAQRAGLSKATVDRVLNHRGGVRASTAAAVARTIAELDEEQRRLGARGQTFRIDVVTHAGSAWPTDIATVLEREVPAELRVRFVFHEASSPAHLVEVLDTSRARGPRGVILKSPDLPEVSRAIGRLVQTGVPVVTVVTDLPLSSRIAYMGIDNRAAGATAAYLVDQWLGEEPGDVLIALGRIQLRDQEEREIGFRSTMRGRRPRVLVETTDPDGTDTAVRDTVTRTLQAHPQIRAVYSIGGRNTAIADAFHSLERPCRAFIGHHLDQQNLELIRDERMSAVLDHDLTHDLRRALHTILAEHGAGAGPTTTASKIHIITPFNIPPLHEPGRS